MIDGDQQQPLPEDKRPFSEEEEGQVSKLSQREDRLWAPAIPFWSYKTAETLQAFWLAAPAKREALLRNALSVTAWAHGSLQQAHVATFVQGQNFVLAPCTAPIASLGTSCSTGFLPGQGQVGLPQLEQFSSSAASNNLYISTNVDRSANEFLGHNFSTDQSFDTKFFVPRTNQDNKDYCRDIFSPPFAKSVCPKKTIQFSPVHSSAQEKRSDSTILMEPPVSVNPSTQDGSSLQTQKTSKSFAEIVTPKVVSDSVPLVGSTPDCGVIMQTLPGTFFEDYARGIVQVAGPKSIVFLGRAPGHEDYMMAFLVSPVLASKVVNSGVRVRGTWLCVTHAQEPATRIMVSGVLPYIKDSEILTACKPFGKPVFEVLKRIPVAIKSPQFSGILSYRREIQLILNKDAVIPDEITVISGGSFHKLQLSSEGTKCYRCSGVGHIAARCRTVLAPSISRPPTISSAPLKSKSGLFSTSTGNTTSKLGFHPIPQLPIQTANIHPPPLLSPDPPQKNPTTANSNTTLNGSVDKTKKSNIFMDKSGHSTPIDKDKINTAKTDTYISSPKVATKTVNTPLTTSKKSKSATQEKDYAVSSFTIADKKCSSEHERISSPLSKAKDNLKTSLLYSDANKTPKKSKNKNNSHRDSTLNEDYSQNYSNNGKHSKPDTASKNTKLENSKYTNNNNSSCNSKNISEKIPPVIKNKENLDKGHKNVFGGSADTKPSDSTFTFLSHGDKSSENLSLVQRKRAKLSKILLSQPGQLDKLPEILGNAITEAQVSQGQEILARSLEDTPSYISLPLETDENVAEVFTKVRKRKTRVKISKPGQEEEELDGSQEIVIEKMPDQVVCSELCRLLLQETKGLRTSKRKAVVAKYMFSNNNLSKILELGQAYMTYAPPGSQTHKALTVIRRDLEMFDKSYSIRSDSRL